MAASDQNEALFLQSLQGASEVWTKFDWSSKSKQWELQASQNKEAREASQDARKKLADTTKQFKRCVKGVEQAGSALASSNSNDNASATVSAIETLAKQCRLTVKSYQEEIDNLTRRCKASESAFGTLQQALNDVPDPSAVLATSIEHAYTQKQEIAQLLRTVDDVNKEMANVEKNARSKAEKVSSGVAKEEKEELMRLRREVAEYEVEFRSLKNQDITIRKLESRIVELQEAGEEELKEQLEKAKQELAETEGRRATEALEREAAMERRVQTLELQLKAELAGKAATQAHLLEANEGAGEREAAWEAQRKILVDDAERLRESLHQATRERDELRLKVAATEGGDGRSQAAPQSGGIAVADLLQERSAYEAELSELSHTANSLREELRHKEEAIVEERQSLQATVTALESDKSILNSNLASLEAQLAAAPSQSLVDSMKHELRVLKRLEYNADDVEVGERDPEIAGRNEDTEKDLESVLVAKLRRVESELVRERNEKSDAIKECEELKNAVAEAQQAKKESEKLVASLEADLDRAIAAPASPTRKSRKAQEAGVTTTDESPATLQSVLDPNAMPPPPLPGKAEGDAAAAVAKKSATEKAEDDHSVATSIMAQRDRLRARCEALEAERDSFKRELQAQVQAAESLKTDNTKLFEKMRYLQSFNSGSAPASRGRGGAAAYSRGGAGRDRDLDLEALEQRYEASVDPFRQFGRAERQRKLKEMSPMERTVFVVAKTMLGTKETRAFLFVYVVAMHLLVFLTTYHWSHSDSGCSIANNEHLSHLPPVVAKSAEEIVKDLSGGGS